MAHGTNTSPVPWRRGEAKVDHVNGGTFFAIFDCQGAWVADVRLRDNADLIVEAVNALPWAKEPDTPPDGRS